MLEQLREDFARLPALLAEPAPAARRAGAAGRASRAGAPPQMDLFG